MTSKNELVPLILKTFKGDLYKLSAIFMEFIYCVWLLILINISIDKIYIIHTTFQIHSCSRSVTYVDGQKILFEFLLLFPSNQTSSHPFEHFLNILMTYFYRKFTFRLYHVRFYSAYFELSKRSGFGSIQLCDT